MECPTCIGRLESKTFDDGRQIYECFICSSQISAPLILDSQRWWGSFHLPLIDVFLNPPTAFRQLNDHPTTLATLCFYALSGAMVRHVAGKMAAASLLTFSQHLLIFGRPLVMTWRTLATGLFITTLQTALLHGTAKFLRNDIANSFHVTYKALWTITLFLSAVFGFFFLIPVYSPYVKFLIPACSALWYLWAIRTIYGFSVWETLSACLISVLLPWSLLTLAGFVGLLSLFRNPAILQRHAPKAGLEAVHAPADYAWQAESADGHMLNMQDLRGKVVFLNFWATWCLPCRMEMPGIQKLYDQFKNDPHVAFVCVSEEPLDVVLKFVNKSGYTFPMFAAKGAIPPAFQSQSIPVTFILSGQGQIVGRHLGSGRWNSKEIIQSLRKLSSMIS